MKQRLEYPYLSNITGEFKYWERVKKMDFFFYEGDQQEANKVDEYDKMNWMLKGMFWGRYFEIGIYQIFSFIFNQ